MTLVTVLIAVPVYVHRIYSSSISDFPDHIKYAKLILDLQYQQVPVHILAHPAYQLLLVGIYLLLFQKVGMYAIAVLVQVVVQILIVLIIYLWFGNNKKNRNWLHAVWAVTLAIVGPVMVFVFWDKFFYLGYIGLATYHNPTIHLLKPVALVSFLCAVRVFTHLRNSWKVVLSSALLVIVSGLIKPNYLMCILPSLGLMVVIYLVWRKPIDWRLLIVGFFVPGILTLTVQLLVTYYLPGNDESSILFSPLGVMQGYSHYLLPKLVLSTLFPLSVLIFNFKQVGRDSTLLLAWLGFLVSLAPTYFLAEGERFGHGNFLWGSQAMLLILFVASARYLWREKMATGLFLTREKAIEFTVYATHVFAGVAYYVSLMVLASFS